MIELLQLSIAPALVGGSTLVARRWHERAAGIVSAFPAIVGPVLLITAHEHGAAFAGRVADGTHRRQGAMAVLELLRGMVAGMVSFVVFCQVVAMLVVDAGVALSFGLATVAAVCAQVAAYRQGSRVVRPCQPTNGGITWRTKRPAT